jgi:hypothetical protein
MATAFTEYASYVQHDPDCVAATLARRYSSKHGALYQFGAVMGFVAVLRSRAPQLPPIFAPELRTYARSCDVPKSIVTALTSDYTALDPVLVQQRLLAAATAMQQWLDAGATPRSAEALP